MSLLLKGCQIIDATTPETRRDRYVLVEGDTIKEVGAGPLPRADRTLDVGDCFLLPGLWDAHTHLTSGTWSPSEVDSGPVATTLTMGRNAMDALQVGVTSMRVLGTEHWEDVAWREAFRSGQFVGPRLFCAGQGLRPTAGHGLTLAIGGIELFDGADSYVKAVRNQIEHGVDQIKLITTGGIMGTGHDVVDAIMFSKDELEAAVRIAHQRGVPVACHATCPKAVKWAAQLGVRSIEHGYILDEEAAALMARQGVYYVPTLALSHLTTDQATTQSQKEYCERNPLPDGFRKRANHFAPIHEESLRMAVQAGVKIASGSDQGPPRDAALLELEQLAYCGLGPYGAIVAATLTSAEVCGAQDRLGTVEPGKLADLIVVDADPLDDIQNLRRIQLVLKGGRVVLDKQSGAEALTG